MARKLKPIPLGKISQTLLILIVFTFFDQVLGNILCLETYSEIAISRTREIYLLHLKYRVLYIGNT